MSESDERPEGYSNLDEADTKPFTEESGRPGEYSQEPVTVNQWKRVPLLKRILTWRKYIILIMTPILLMPLPIAVKGTESRCAYCILIMAVYWVTEAVELAVTALLPLVLFPLFGVLGSKQVSTPYFKDTNVLFFGGLIVAVAVEQWNLHKRIALRVLLLVGAQPRRLMLGVMLTTSFLSMWISNTATTAMMVPIVEAVLGEIKNENIKIRSGKNIAENEQENENMYLELIEMNKNKEEKREDRMATANLLKVNEDRNEAETRYFNRMCKAMMLAVAYAANIGGTATLTGTGPNLVFGGQAGLLFPKSGGFSFASWFGYAFPQMVILLFVAWIWIQFLFLGFNFRKCFCKSSSGREKDNQSTQAIRQVLVDQYRALGPMSFAEKAVLGHFILLALLWLFREPKFMEGWSIIFEKGYVRDATAAMFVAFCLFVFPSQKPVIFIPDGSVRKPPPCLLQFKTMSKRFPWHLVLLLGSGFALAEACKVSGLSEWVGAQLRHLDAIPSYAIGMCVCIMITTFTEFTSNVATATIFLPILASLAEAIEVHPWYIMIPATISCSFAFMLPVATPPNAIVFAGGHLKVKDMAKAGLGMNLLAVIVLVICVNTYGVPMFDLHNFPDWAGSIGPISSTAATPTPPGNFTLLCLNFTSS
ncbi:Solute carrier family 13 member 2 [Stylophora pistillata]|uniref:Solute carrier family 13 member 2 n=1 Tax=Stylophora pistillata TaxID=50429 RepID=A0A2B4SQT4_STYPI|nr:Solute carrier family 13 member 2 [Stylophora pistillata]